MISLDFARLSTGVVREPSGSSQRKYAYNLSFLLTFLLTILVFLTPILDKPLTKHILSMVGGRVRYVQASISRVSDPHLGVSLYDFLPSSSETDQISRHKPFFLVFIGSCAGCVQGSIESWESSLEQYPTQSLIFVSRDTKEAIAQFRKKAHIKTPIIADADGKIQRAFHATYIPRAYRFQVDGKLSWLQTKEDNLPNQLIEECLQEERRK